ncbi:zinc ribbon domain-containing protein [Brasilonema bromeliae]|uniref:Cas12f1-like TNB domain-containing protein n=1 Tax=Brasilonema bromeliae SPC951 TaxID=385972 RepID=A0ABX1P3Y3_9CYAN|nr:zinc ribbon domain-containing protein [Brasilonema bromeliae]NMG18272.1 hypothetical protein [Brasilonema bromeliae SPC951]
MKIIYFGKILTIWLFVEFLLSLSLSAHAQEKLEARSTTLPQQLISQQNFIPPRQGKPKDTSGAGSRSRLCENCGTSINRDVNAAINLSRLATA